MRHSKDIIALSIPMGFFIGMTVALASFLWSQYSVAILFPALWLWVLLATVLRGVSQGINNDTFHLAAVLVANIAFYAILAAFLLARDWRRAAMFAGVNLLLSGLLLWAVPDLQVL